jgi:hypothetical protein
MVNSTSLSPVQWVAEPVARVVAVVVADAAVVAALVPAVADVVVLVLLLRPVLLRLAHKAHRLPYLLFPLGQQVLLLPVVDRAEAADAVALLQPDRNRLKPVC